MSFLFYLATLALFVITTRDHVQFSATIFLAVLVVWSWKYTHQEE